MRPIRWIHISDIHMSARDEWSQDVVLTAMCNQISSYRADGVTADFILLTGDLAFSGKAEEYKLVVDFLDALCDAAQVSKERIFCIPGNHDIDRDKQKLCFQGARLHLQNQNRIDAVLAGGDDLATLLDRQESYRQFQKQYFANQERWQTKAGLAYVSKLAIEDVVVAILGLDSSWLANGGSDDHGKLLVGEKQVIDALRILQEDDNQAHILIAMAHHPLHLLRDYDRRPVMNRIERKCHFLHCGHLHEPEARTTLSGSTACLTLGAGATFESRESHNSYSVITLDLLRGTRKVATHQFNPADGTFSSSSAQEYSIEVNPTDLCNVGELAQAMSEFDNGLNRWSHYFSALLLEKKAELPVPLPNGHTFASYSALQGLPESELKLRTANFLTFRNALRVLYPRRPLSDIFGQHGGSVAQYGEYLTSACDTDTELLERMDAQERDARQLVSTTLGKSSSYTNLLLAELAEAQDWQLLRDQALRHIDSSDPATAVLAKRMLALGMANSEEMVDKSSAIEIYRSISEAGAMEPSDVGNLAKLLSDAGKHKEAKMVVLDGIRNFPLRADYFAQIGHQIVEATGDKIFRTQLEDAIKERGESE